MIMSFKEIYSCFNKLSSINASEQLKKRRNSIEKTLENVDFFLAPSLYIKKQFEALGIHSDKIILHCLGLAIPKARVVGKRIDNRIKFAFIGTIIPAKGVHILIKAFNGIKSDSAILRIYGKLKDYAGFGGYPQSLKAAKKNKNIEFIGEFCHEEVEKVLSTIDVLIVPSVWQENNPLIIREAFAARVPVVASRMGGIPETLVDGVNGLLFQPGSVNELRNKMQFIIDHPNIIDIFKSSLPQVKSIQEEINELEARYDKAVKANSYAMKDIFLS
jgi:glycosyltransferase involved in cell wall biosynthesis